MLYKDSEETIVHSNEDFSGMVHFRKRSDNVANIDATPEDWAGITAIMNEVSNPEVFYKNELEPMGMVKLEEVQKVSNDLSLLNTNLKVLTKDNLRVLCCVFQNLTVAHVELPEELVPIAQKLEADFYNCRVRNVFK